MGFAKGGTPLGDKSKLPNVLKNAPEICAWREADGSIRAQKRQPNRTIKARFAPQTGKTRPQQGLFLPHRRIQFRDRSSPAGAAR
jgi:hypothetical protein